MESRQKVLELIRRFEDLPEGNESILRSLLVDLKFFIQENFGSDSQYLGYLRYVKFRPEAVFITDKERERSWHDGIAQVDNLLRVILNDTKITPAPAQSSIITPVEETVQTSLADFKDIVRMEYPLLEEGPILEPLRDDLAEETAGPLLEDPKPKTNDELTSAGRVLCVLGNATALNEDVLNFLNDLPAEVLSIPKAVGQESLIDRLGRCPESDFVIFVLSPDFHFYSRTQRPVDASLMSAQEAVFQLGYFAAKFDRQKMVVLYQEDKDFVLPTEFSDLLYVPLSSSGLWKAEVIRRMKGKLSLPAGLGLSMERQPSA